ncbi:MAG: hypothetical protein RJQ00_09990 [Vicingaceae bacterium]
MDIQSKRDEVQGLIDNIKEHSDRLKHSKTLPLLELSVILSKITQLHEKTLILKYVAAIDQDHAEEEFGSKALFQKNEEKDDLDSTESKSTEKPEPKKVINKKENKEKPESVEAPEFKKVPESEDEENTPAAEHLKEISDVDTRTGFEEIEAKQELDSKPDLNEAFTEEEDPSLSGQLRKQPIQDLLTAIGLNERYLYANELFDGNIDDFRESIRKLNEFEDGAKAKAYFDSELRKKYGWEKDSEMANALYLLVERRYN